MELEKGDLETLPVFTFIRARHKDVAQGGWRYLLFVPPTKEQGRMWLDDTGVRWPTRNVKADLIELLWHPQGLHVIPAPDMAEVRVLKQVANGADKPRVAPPRLVPPADYEPENAATDGSQQMENAVLRSRVMQQAGTIKAQDAVLLGARALVDNLQGQAQDWGINTEPARQLRELTMLLNGGDAIRRTARADEAVEAWLQDPHRSVFGLAADLADILSPTKGAWKK